MKKGQFITQVFIYIVSAAVFITILLFGYQAITGLLESQDTILMVDFKSNLESKVEKLQVRRGSVEIVEFALPRTFHRLCIADSAGNGAGLFEDTHPQFARAWQTNTENVFLVPKQDVAIYVPNINIDGGFFCADIEGTFSLRMEGVGRAVKVSPP
jgi:hypothetical protein